MKRKPVRLAVTSLVVALSVFGLSTSPASAKVAHHHTAAKVIVGGGWCC